MHNERTSPEPPLLGEGQTRPLRGIWLGITSIIAIVYVLFHLYTAGYQLYPNLIQRSIHIGFAITLCFLLYPARKRDISRSRPKFYDLIFILFMAWAVVYTVVNYDRIVSTIAGSTIGDRAAGLIFLVLILEASRRAVGPILPLFALSAILYTLFGHYIPGMWGHPPFSLTVLLEHMYIGTSGIFGIIVNISATLIAVFVIFATILLTTGGGQAFMNIALLLAGRYRGGAAKVATVASALFGTISGSASSNVVITGSYTIPTMKRLGYRPEFAAAVEATASSGGQIMPPIMGAGAFIMAELLGIPYIKIVVAAFIPAVLYFLGVGLAIHMEARRIGLKGLPPEQIPSMRTVLQAANIATVIIPLIALVYFLFQGYTPMRAGFYAIVTAVILYLASMGNKNVLKERMGSLLRAAENAGRALILVAPLLACAQILISLIGLTGLGVKLSEAIVQASGSFMPLALILSMIVCMILGMGISSAAAYILAAAVVGPALINLGIAPLPAHMFLFYFSVFGTITPPVCIAVFVASGIANSKWPTTAWIACRLGLAAFIVPFMFINNQILLMNGSLHRILIAFITSSMGILALSAGSMGFLIRKTYTWERALLLGGALLLISPEIYSDIIGIALLGIVYWRQRSRENGLQRKMELPPANL